jgi:hypothetical protein
MKASVAKKKSSSVEKERIRILIADDHTGVRDGSLRLRQMPADFRSRLVPE